MPFKGDMRLGGPHDNEATLNGTSSEFAGVPAYGTVLSGPTDTSRNEADFVGTEFLMPYSTTVYADGLGGQYSTETWGLQYLPAGWVTNRVDTDYTIEIADTSFLYQTIRTDYIEDGTGINYESPTTTFLAEAGDYIGQDAPTAYTNGTLLEVPSESGNFIYNQIEVIAYYYNGLTVIDGGGGWYSEQLPNSVAYYPTGADTGERIDSTFEFQLIMDGPVEFIADGKYSLLLWDGQGNYENGPLQGSFTFAGTVFQVSDESQMCEVVELDAFFPNGKYDRISYRHTGGGGWYSTGPVTMGDYSDNGTVFYTYVPEPLTTSEPYGFAFDLSNPEEITDYFDTKRGETWFVFDGTGGYTIESVQVYFPAGTYFATFDGNNYYWDGTGNFYTEPF